MIKKRKTKVIIVKCQKTRRQIGLSSKNKENNKSDNRNKTKLD